MAGLEINEQGMRQLRQMLAKKLFDACSIEGVEEVRSNTPVWSKRLYNSTRAEPPIVERDRIECDIVAGGVSLPGELEERGIRKDVDYALDQETKKMYIRSNLGNIEDAIIRGLEQ